MKKEKEKKNHIIFLNSDPTWLGFINIKAPNFLSLYIFFAFIYGFAASLVPGWNQATLAEWTSSTGMEPPALTPTHLPADSRRRKPLLVPWAETMLHSGMLNEQKVVPVCSHVHNSQTCFLPWVSLLRAGLCVCVCVPLDYKTNDNGFFLTHSFCPGAPALQVPQSSTGGSSGNPGTGWLLWQKRQARPGRPGSLSWGARETAHLGNFLRKKT